MKEITLLATALVLLFLVGCTPSNSTAHRGCQEDETDEQGNCVPAPDNNANIFGQEFTGEVTTQELEGTAQGFLAQPRQEGRYPGIIMIHEWWGLNSNIKYMAQLLANEGYVVLAVDLYDGVVAEDAETAGTLAGKVRNNPEQALAKMKSAVQYLRDHQEVEHIASLGWCFGGQQSLQLSLHEQLDATVIYYGHLVEDRGQLSHIKGPVLGIFGQEDTSIPVPSVTAFKEALTELGIENNIYLYPGVGHAFANPSGGRYAEEETKDAWKKTVAFLEQHLKQQERST